MSKYTTELRFLCEHYAGLSQSVDYPDVNQVIQGAIPAIFSFSYPIFDESYRNVLETKILKHYYTREIAFETPGLWKLKLDTKLNEIIPYYNQLYKSTLLDFNPFYDVDLTRDHVTQNQGKQDVTGNANVNADSTQDVTGKIDKTTTESEKEHSTNDGTQHGSTSETTQETTKQDQNNTTNHMDAYSDTPQGALTDVESLTYLTNARKITDSDTGATSGSSNGSSSGTTENTTTTAFDGTSNIDKQTNQTDTTKTVNNATTITNNTTNTVISNTEDYLEHVKGKQGVQSYSSLLKEFRETMLNIDLMLIEELSDLFFTLY